MESQGSLPRLVVLTTCPRSKHLLLPQFFENENRWSEGEGGGGLRCEHNFVTRFWYITNWAPEHTCPSFCVYVYDTCIISCYLVHSMGDWTLKAYCLNISPVLLSLTAALQGVCCILSLTAALQGVCCSTLSNAAVSNTDCRIQVFRNRCNVFMYSY